MSTIKAIESSTVHKIQSGQVIVDLCSVAKELIENSIDAGATSIDVRFKNQGLDSIEVQDNGSGISPENYAGVGLKHHTSKLSTYEDISNLNTFGFRGEALSSCCALSKVSIVTCRAEDAPKGAKLRFKQSGVLEDTSMVAAQKGTTVVVQDLFYNLPVRRKELERNIKREWNKLISLLNQYACIQTGLKFTVSQQPNKGKKIIMFSTKGNANTRDNIINVFGAKTMAALVPLDLSLELRPTVSGLATGTASQNSPNIVKVKGHVSRPAHGEGRQTPDRQMFYINGRPCGLPQFAKVFNEVYRSYNSSQSPFILADVQLDTHLYDVNVSPDKRTILLHDQGPLLERLKETLIELFANQDYTVPVAQLWSSKKGAVSSATSARQESSATPSRQPFLRTQASVSSQAGSDETPSRRPSALRSQQKRSSHSSSDEDDENEDKDGEDLSQQAHAKHLTPASSNDILSSLPAFVAAAQRQTQSSPSQKVLERLQQKAMAQNKAQESGVKFTTATSILKEQKLEELESQKEADESESDLEDVIHDPSVPRPVRDFHAQLARQARKGQDNQQSIKSHSRQDDEDSHDDDELFVRQEESRNDDPSDDSDDNNKVITVIARKRNSKSAPLVQIGGTFKRPSDVAVISIGNNTVTRSIGHSSSRTPRSTATRIQPSRSSNTPSFGGRLAEMFALQKTKQSNRDEIEGEEENDDEMEEDEEEQTETASSSMLSRKRKTPATELDADPALDTSGDIRLLDVDMDEDDQLANDNDSTKAATTLQGESSGPVQHTALAARALKGPAKKDSTVSLVQHLKISEDSLRGNLAALKTSLTAYEASRPSQSVESPNTEGGGLEAPGAEEKLSLTISKGDFGRMKIVGQFNLGFILAVRSAAIPDNDADDQTADGSNTKRQDEVFIIDQHATDEKYNFERLQATTVVQSQRLVNPKTLDLTALEEEIVLENRAALEANGFDVSVDVSGESAVGSRCQLLALPLSRETTFTLADLEELISLLGDHEASALPASLSLGSSGSSKKSTVKSALPLSAAMAASIPRPTKVRKMFAMRACRSSVMIGKALTQGQMETLVRHMGELDKPWNCPHGRPTMRHLCSLGFWEEEGWKEAQGANWIGAEEEYSWREYLG
ncbi:Mismatch repair endonuclease PMS2 [Ceratocystis fimbriata CBS 114723]|uniref:Mismatch repair endonuclease PMS2 n=1 Tax=Ceratocystis fimbriata CBS 114723 TaxID=1035309 RepID=A0A2C5X2E9_9PEZI|nr:Mismatch repair endonuclease PMS2 [Ceratocystis fimbriata CBS 114723]